MTKPPEDALQQLHGRAREHAELICSIHQAVAQKTMTPIEQVMYYHLQRLAFFTSPRISLEPQQKIGRYRVDFLLQAKGSKGIVIECDGHDFHERTKEQAQRDKKRDRDLQALGYVVLRFTGSEIWKDGRRCAIEAVTASGLEFWY